MPDRAKLPAMVTTGTNRISATVAAEIAVPRVIADAGDLAARRFLEFFAATICQKSPAEAVGHDTIAGPVSILDCQHPP